MITVYVLVRKAQYLITCYKAFEKLKYAMDKYQSSHWTSKQAGDNDMWYNAISDSKLVKGGILNARHLRCMKMIIP